VVDLKSVVDFIKENYSKFSREGLRYAIEKMDSDLRRELMDYKNNLKKRKFEGID
jgi:hypothetical protein